MTDEKYRISNSSIKTVLRCEQQYVYKYVQGIVPRMPALPLKLGSWLHSLLEHRYVDGTWKKEHKRLSKEFGRLFAEEQEHYGDLPAQASSVMLGYDAHWLDDHEDWDIKDAEVKIEYPLNDRWTYVAVLDVVAENDEGVWIWDHKTFKQKAPTADYRIIDPQSALYVWVYEKLTSIKPAGFVFNYVRTKLPTVPPLLKSGNAISKAKKYDTNELTLLATLKQYGLDPADYQTELADARSRNGLFYDRVFIPRPAAVIRNILADIKELLPRIRALHEGKRPTRTLTRDCEHSCGYYMVCLTELTGGNSEYIRKHQYTLRVWEEFDGNEKPIEEE